MNVGVLGIGNVLLRDEGAGVRAIEELESRYIFPDDVELLDGGTAGIELLQYIQEKDLLIIIDAMRNGQAPGTVYRLEDEEVPAAFMTSISPHQLGISDLLAKATLIDALPERLLLYGIEPKDLTTGIGLSAEVELGLGQVILEVVALLEKNGLKPMVLERSASSPRGFWFRNASAVDEENNSSSANSSSFCLSMTAGQTLKEKESMA
ncbi:MAG: HyaD/HybD family hydrogenase maturation endopeptidase [Proteobacteria bacterium]|nr:HyaD/HybD family hydrogenase maturation endopeptidase [Pseudomonadota bacterium]